MKKKIEEISIIIKNKNVLYQYFIEEEIEAGLSLQGWEVKSLRYRKANISNSYIKFINNEAYLVGAFIKPFYLSFSDDPIRFRKILLKQCEINSLCIAVHRNGYTMIVLSLYWKNSWIKIKIGLAKGKKEYEKRKEIKYHTWKREKCRIMKK